MRIIHAIFPIVVVFSQLQNAVGQDFFDLNFEDAVIVPVPSGPYYPYSVYASDALPGWTVGVGNFQGTGTIFYNDESLGATAVQLFGVNSQYSAPPLDGNFSIDLYGGVTSTAGASISQTALVPAGTAAIEFIASGNPQYGGPLLVSLGGQNVSYSAISTAPSYTTYAGNIPLTLAGQIETLSFTAPEGNNNYWEMDDIQFSSTAVPEPYALGWICLCAFFLCRSTKWLTPCQS
jgi:hypothetical protein